MSAPATSRKPKVKVSNFDIRARLAALRSLSAIFYDAKRPMNSRLLRRTLLALRDGDLHTRAVDFHGEHFPTGLDDRGLDPFAGIRLD